MVQTILYMRGARMGKLISKSRGVDMILTNGDLFKMEGDHRKTTIACLEGRLWVTQESDGGDYLVLAGQSFMISRSGSVLIQGQPQARFELLPPSRA